MSLNAVKILKISITKSDKTKILEYIQKYLDDPQKKPLIIVTPNPEQVVLAQNNERFAKMLNKADIAIPDGIGIARILDIQRIPGVELMEDLVSLAADQRIPVGLIGGRGRVAVEALERLHQKHSDLSGWAIEPEKFSMQNIVKKIQQTKTRILFIGLGAPKQEFFIEELSKECNAVFMAVGGSFDIIADRITRAPKIYRMMGFEWLWRLGRQPWRWRRQLALAKFLWFVFREKVV